MSVSTLVTLRIGLFALTGVTCLVYACLALATATPNPMPAAIPGLLGAMTGVVLTMSARFSKEHVVDQAYDELHTADATRAAVLGFWVAVLLYPVFGLLIGYGLVASNVGFAAMGPLTAAAYLLSHGWYDFRGRL